MISSFENIWISKLYNSSVVPVTDYCLAVATVDSSVRRYGRKSRHTNFRRM